MSDPGIFDEFGNSYDTGNDGTGAGADNFGLTPTDYDNASMFAWTGGGNDLTGTVTSTSDYPVTDTSSGGGWSASDWAAFAQSLGKTVLAVKQQWNNTPPAGMAGPVTGSYPDTGATGTGTTATSSMSKWLDPHQPYLYLGIGAALLLVVVISSGKNKS